MLRLGLMLRTIKQLRFDNVNEFKMPNFFKNNGIIHQLSCIETPQQNVVVERKHQRILNVARSLRFQAGLPLKFWGHCVLTVVYIINSIPTPLFEGKSPYEKLLSHPSSYNHMRIFGCLCFASTLYRSRTKFDPHAKACIFLGYLHGIKGYVLYDLK